MKTCGSHTSTQHFRAFQHDRLFVTKLSEEDETQSLLARTMFPSLKLFRNLFKISQLHETMIPSETQSGSVG